MNAPAVINVPANCGMIEHAIRKRSPHVTHNSGEVEWYTPPDIIERARGAMGAIDCDPASNAFANKNVKADTFYTVEDNGLEKKWHGRVWMNPPYARGICAQFCDAVVRKFEDKEIEQACVLVNNATDTKWFQRLAKASTAVCILRGRVKFLDRNGRRGHPLQGQWVLYFGPSSVAFAEAFSGAGAIRQHIIKNLFHRVPA